MSVIVSRELIAKEARDAALAQLHRGEEPVNPYFAGSDAALAWQASLVRWQAEIRATSDEGSSA